MAASNVKVLGAWPSPYTMRVRIALNLKNVDYEYLERNPERGPPELSELIHKTNPVHKMVPVLIHNNKPICESLIIVQYIDEAFTSGPSILPSDPYDRSVARFWGAYIDDKVRNDTSYEEAFEKISKGKDFFGGDTIGYIDIAFGTNLAWVRVFEKLNLVKLLDETKTPNLYAWSKKFCSVPAVKAGIFPETDKLLEFVKTLIAKYDGLLHHRENV
ncbi:hypothetical protein IFM89_026708 [Coptis chinensis]|uniref:glutathione transferase n=1 Tax=Coptis chinensis TaxID=261450 RepID=A0A835LIV8_9MAGN|nr:hypothetical protein IFM89_017650 [Coptis chinensis]KAF9625746.1 hypothetical protein IFM89_026708 [Coptis chinensis]